MTSFVAFEESSLRKPFKKHPTYTRCLFFLEMLLEEKSQACIYIEEFLSPPRPFSSCDSFTCGNMRYVFINKWGPRPAFSITAWEIAILWCLFMVAVAFVASTVLGHGFTPFQSRFLALFPGGAVVRLYVC
jgi:hypothetical protein